MCCITVTFISSATSKQRFEFISERMCTSSPRNVVSFSQETSKRKKEVSTICLLPHFTDTCNRSRVVILKPYTGIRVRINPNDINNNIPQTNNIKYVVASHHNVHTPYTVAMRRFQFKMSLKKPPNYGTVRYLVRLTLENEYI